MTEMVYGSRKAIDGAGGAIMVGLCVVLGLHQVVIKLAAPDMAPILQIALRSGLSAILILLLIAWRSEKHSWRDGTLGPGLLLGLLFSLEFVFVAEGLRYTTASHMSVFLYTAPVFTALALHRIIAAERLSRVQWMGIALAFCGILAAFSGGIFGSTLDARVFKGDILALLGGLAWASTTITIRCSRLSEAPATKTLLYQLLSACLLLHLYAVVSGQTATVSLTRTVIASVLFQAVFITFATYLIWFSLLRRYIVAQLSAFLFLTPLFGVTFGVIVLHDRLDYSFAAGALLVLSGITLVSCPGIIRRKHPAPRKNS